MSIVAYANCELAFYRLICGKTRLIKIKTRLTSAACRAAIAVAGDR